MSKNTEEIKTKKHVITPILRNQVHTFIDTLAAFNEKRKTVGFRGQDQENYVFAKDFFLRFLEDRNTRALEVSQGAYAKVVELAHSLIPVPTLWNICVDGRVLLILIFGGAAKIGSRVRVPAGMLAEFVVGTDGRRKLLEDSNFAKLLESMLGKFDVIAEVFDSHIGCAARNAEELAKGRDAKDSGLMSDVLDKKNVIIAMQQYTKEKFGDNKHIIAIQTSFDPHTGYMYMGFETNEALAYARKREEEKANEENRKVHLSEYSQDIIDSLVREEKVISTQKLVADPKVYALFAKYAFQIDWKTKYVESTKKFWQAIAKLEKTMIPLIHTKLLRVYPHLVALDANTQKELQERTVLLLANAFSGYLNNLETGYKHKHIHPHHKDYFYQYSDHTEEGVNITLSSNSPYQISMFGVSPEVHVAFNVAFSVLLVRSNRKAGRIFDRSRIFKDANAFAAAPVPIVLQEVIRDKISKDEWKNYSITDWSDMPANWDAMGDIEFMEYLQNKGIKNSSLLIGINNLRKRMVILYDPNQQTCAHIVRHYQIVLPLMADKNRYNYFVVPFIKLGF